MLLVYQAVPRMHENNFGACVLSLPPNYLPLLNGSHCSRSDTSRFFQSVLKQACCVYTYTQRITTLLSYTFRITHVFIHSLRVAYEHKLFSLVQIIR
jgi:hypothetical protein